MNRHPKYMPKQVCYLKHPTVPRYVVWITHTLCCKYFIYQWCGLHKCPSRVQAQECVVQEDKGSKSTILLSDFSNILGAFLGFDS
ncbi:hypothetical protein AX774_g326 [Zancudomyces culisetae]|uniref:Uncharacterized protein n=1 Tax=Zancudomyces culisetae TaxID=1213189 RepID=A0A1R1PYS3_ZANCU|nr:hypothetical protein AX774_g326 [Zancudomyces culisetae]|eukprot:OMH86097.1 hypothetical protein AX774_g326 [Zancudomyces culisetae]